MLVVPGRCLWRRFVRLACLHPNDSFICIADSMDKYSLLATPKLDVEIREAISQLRMLDIGAKVAGFKIVGAAEDIRGVQVRNLKKVLARAAIERALKIF